MFRKKRSFYYGKIPNIYIATPKPKKEKKFPWRGFKIFFLIIILLSILYLIFYSPFFLIKNVRLEGSQSDRIINLANKAKNQNLWLYHKKQLKEEILKSAEISDISISKRPMATLIIKIIQKSEGIVIRTQDKMYLLDNNGNVIREVTETSLPMVLDLKNAPAEIGKQILSPNFVSFVKNVNIKFNSISGLPLKEMQIPTETTFELIVQTEGFKVIFDTQGNVDQQLSNMVKVYQMKKDEIKEYMDLRIEGRVYYK